MRPQPTRVYFYTCKLFQVTIQVRCLTWLINDGSRIDCMPRKRLHERGRMRERIEAFASVRRQSAGYHVFKIAQLEQFWNKHCFRHQRWCMQTSGMPQQGVWETLAPRRTHCTKQACNATDTGRYAGTAASRHVVVHACWPGSDILRSRDNGITGTLKCSNNYAPAMKCAGDADEMGWRLA